MIDEDQRDSRHDLKAYEIEALATALNVKVAVLTDPPTRIWRAAISDQLEYSPQLFIPMNSVQSPVFVIAGKFPNYAVLPAKLAWALHSLEYLSQSRNQTQYNAYAAFVKVNYEGRDAAIRPTIYNYVDSTFLDYLNDPICIDALRQDGIPDFHGHLSIYAKAKRPCIVQFVDDANLVKTEKFGHLRFGAITLAGESMLSARLEYQPDIAYSNWAGDEIRTHLKNLHEKYGPPVTEPSIGDSAI